MKGLTACFIILIFTACDLENKPGEEQIVQKLPYIGHHDLEYSEVNGVQIIDTVHQSIRSFNYLNQDSLSVTNKSYENKIWIAEFFFATCPTICPIMNIEMTRLQNEIDEMGLSEKVQFLSFSIDPDKDTPSALRSYKDRYCNNCNNWDFLTGDEEFTHRLGIESFKIFSGREEEAEGGYAHSGAFSMVDPSGYLRGVYNITGYDGSVNKNEYRRLKKELRILIDSLK